MRRWGARALWCLYTFPQGKRCGVTGTAGLWGHSDTSSVTAQLCASLGKPVSLPRPGSPPAPHHMLPPGALRRPALGAPSWGLPGQGNRRAAVGLLASPSPGACQAEPNQTRHPADHAPPRAYVIRPLQAPCRKAVPLLLQLRKTRDSTAMESSFTFSASSVPHHPCISRPLSATPESGYVPKPSPGYTASPPTEAGTAHTGYRRLSRPDFVLSA